MIAFIGQFIRDWYTFFPTMEHKGRRFRLPNYISNLTILTPDKEQLQALYFKQSKSDRLIIYFHGNSGNLYSRIHWAKRLFGLNHSVLLVSYRGYADSTGKPSEAGIYIDGHAALDYAINILGYAESNISLYGRSLGSTVAINTAQHRGIFGTILISPLTSGKDMATAMGLDYLKVFAGDSFSSISKLNNISSKLLVIHGAQDNVIPLKMGQRIYHNYIGGPKDLLVIDNGNHSNIQDISPHLFWRKVAQFLTQ